MIKNSVKFGLASLLLASASFAHEFWVDGYNSNVFKANIGYGHEFPLPEKIDPERLSIFEAVVLTDKNMKTTTLKNSGENYQFIANSALGDGTYVLSANYKPTYWIKTADSKWYAHKTRNDFPDAQLCEKATRFAKSIINIGDSKDDYVTKPINQKFEIVPLVNPADIKVGVPFKMKVLLDGKAARGVQLKGTIEGFGEERFAFVGPVGLNGEIEVVALKGGKWMFLVETTKKTDNKECESDWFSTSITFTIN